MSDASKNSSTMNSNSRKRSSTRSGRRRIVMREIADRVATRPSSSDSSDSDSGFLHLRHVTNRWTLPSVEEILRIPNVDDSILDQASETEALSDESPPLLIDSAVTIHEAIGSLMRFAVNASLDKYKTDQLLRLVKTLIPASNNLPTRHSRILRQFGRCTMFSTKYLCLYCDSQLIARSGGRDRKACSNPICDSSRSVLRSIQMTEVVTIDIRSALSSILTRNISLLQGHEDLFPKSDPINFDVYRQQQKDAQGRDSVSDHLETFF